MIGFLVFLLVYGLVAVFLLYAVALLVRDIVEAFRSRGEQFAAWQAKKREEGERHEW